MKPQNKQMHLPNFTQKNVQLMWLYNENQLQVPYRLLISDMKRNTEIDGMGSFNIIKRQYQVHRQTFITEQNFIRVIKGQKMLNENV